jgi:hypothetical protein
MAISPQLPHQRLRSILNRLKLDRSRSSTAWLNMPVEQSPHAAFMGHFPRWAA